jgi:hypothetical protein
MQLVMTNRAGLHFAGNKREGEDGEDTNIVVMKPDMAGYRAGYTYIVQFALRIPMVSRGMR